MILKNVLTGIAGYFVFACIAIFGLVTIIGSGGEEGEALVTVYNYEEDHAYIVELFYAGDASLLSSFILDEYDPDDAEAVSDTFEDIAEGDYYLVIRYTEDESNVVREQSRVFELVEGESECFYIDESGDLDDC